MKVFLITLFLVSVGGIHDWSSFKAAFQKTYSSPDEEQQREQNFLSNLKRINEHNARYYKGEETYWMGMNHFGDRSNKELTNTNVVQTCTQCEDVFDHSHDPPSSYDWRDVGIILPVEDQGDCNCGWAFSVAGAIEASIAWFYGQHVTISKQQLLDCAENTTGCNGGSPMLGAYSYAHSNGLADATRCPYKGKIDLNDTCAFLECYPFVTTRTCYAIPAGNESLLQEWVGTTGTVSAGMDAENPDFKFYAGGIWTNSDCNAAHTNHGVLVVGYGSENGTDYWIAKNSWGRDWGEHGFFRLIRNYGNHCGIASCAASPYPVDLYY